MDLEQFLQQETQRASVYKLLSRFYYLPGKQTQSQIAELQEVLTEAYPEAAQSADAMAGELNFDQLQIDFSRLFVGPFKLLAPPYGSVYLESGRRVMGDSTMDAKNRYRKAGLDFSDSVKEAPDHIALELEFMYYLIFKAIEAIENTDTDAALSFIIKQKEFLVEHLGAWIDEFTAQIESEATEEFYKNLAIITRLFIQKDKSELLKGTYADPIAR